MILSESTIDPTIGVNESPDTAATSHFPVEITLPHNSHRSPAPNPLNAMRVEAENMLLDNYRVEILDFASNEAVASFVGGTRGETGRTSLEFASQAGTYDVVVGYFDEEGGGARITASLNGETVDSFKLDQKLGSNQPTPENFVRRQLIESLVIRPGDTFTLFGEEEANEHSRIDYAEFSWIDSVAEVDVKPHTVDDSLPDPIRINVGSDMPYTDRAGEVWIADTFFEDGAVATIEESILDTQDDELYQSGRYAYTIDYEIPVDNGLHDVDLHFAEVFYSESGDRTFNIEIEGRALTEQFDIYKKSGINRATAERNSILVSDGTLNVHLEATEALAQLSAIEVSAKALIEPGEPIRVNAGGERYTDGLGQTWLADVFFEDGQTAVQYEEISNTDDDELFQSDRRAQTLDYSVPVPNGVYGVNLLFSENQWNEANKRVFDVVVEDRAIVQNLDMYATAGRNAAYIQAVDNVTVTDSTLNISLTSTQDLAQLSAFEILTEVLFPPEDSGSPTESEAPPVLPDRSTPGSGGLPAGTPLGAAPLTEGATIRYITPNGSGNGTSWQQPTNLLGLNTLIAQSAPGDEIWIAGDLGSYDVAEQVTAISHGSTGTAPIYIRGVAAAQGGNETPLFIGDRAPNWTPGQSNGSEVFRLLAGANHLHFSGLNFENIGNGAFRFGDELTGITLESMEANNVRRFVENFVSGGASSASVSNLVIRDVQIMGFSKGAIRLQYNTNNVLIEDVLGDSQQQDGDNFAMGIQLAGTAHDVIHRRVTMNNSIQTKSEDAYWNGDGFVSEGGTYRITYEDTSASGSTDGGYDLKSLDTLLVRASAADNKRNFRIWGTATMVDVISDEPFRRGGTGTTAHIHVLGNGNLTLRGGIFSGDQTIENIIFDLDDNGSLDLDGATITDDSYILQTVGQGSILLVNLDEPRFSS